LRSVKKKNYGFGNQLYWAGEEALRRIARDGGGRFSWLKTTTLRWRRFCDFCSENNIKDARNINKELVSTYSKTLKSYSCATQQNYLSAINTTMASLAGEAWDGISPSQTSGTKRKNIRTKPISVSAIRLANGCDEIAEKVGVQFSFVVQLAYEFGLRRRESLLLEYHVAKKQIAEFGHIDVIRGTKGGRGRSIARLIPASEAGRRLVESICREFPSHRCLLLDKSYKFVSRKISSDILPLLKSHDIDRLHELRVAYACRRYIELTGAEPPCNETNTRVKKEVDRSARLAIALELGHSRVEILNSYIGSSHHANKYLPD